MFEDDFRLATANRAVYGKCLYCSSTSVSSGSGTGVAATFISGRQASCACNKFYDLTMSQKLID